MKVSVSRMSWIVGFVFVMFALAPIIVGCSGDPSDAGAKESNSATSASPKAKDDYATTTEGQKVLVRMVANDTGSELQIDELKGKDSKGDIICEAEIKSGLLKSCSYEAEKGFTGNDEFSYVVKDKNGKTDEAKVIVRVKPAS